MPVVSTANPSRVQIKVQKGTSPEGKAIVGSFSYTCLKPTATDTQVFDFAEAISQLQSRPVLSIGRVDSEGLVNSL